MSNNDNNENLAGGNEYFDDDYTAPVDMEQYNHKMEEYLEDYMMDALYDPSSVVKVHTKTNGVAGAVFVSVQSRGRKCFEQFAVV